MSFHDLEAAKLDDLENLEQRERLERLLYGTADGISCGSGNGSRSNTSQTRTAGRWQPYLIGVAATLFLVGFCNILQPLQNEQSTKKVSVDPLQSSEPFPLSRELSLSQTTVSGTETTFSAPKMGLTGVIDSRTMRASYYCTVVFKHDSAFRQEGVATLHLPEGAVVSRATDWVNGIPQEAAFNTKARVNTAYETVVAERREPLLVNLNNDKTVTIKAFPVNPNGGRMKVRIGITAPLTVDESGMCSIAAPYLISSNFSTMKTEDVHLQGDSNIGFSLEGEDSEHTVAGSMNDHVLTEQFSQSQLEHLRVMTEATSGEPEFAVRATHSTEGHYIRVSLKRSPDGKGFVTDLNRTSVKPDLPVVNDEHAAFRLSSLWAAKEVDRFLRAGDVQSAEKVATIYRLVTPVTSAVVFESNLDYDRFGLHRKRYSVLGDDLHSRVSRSSDVSANLNASAASPLEWSGSSQPVLKGAAVDFQAPALQGATNGAVGPQGADATFVTGVNTAGTVIVSDRTVSDMVPFANLAMCFAGIFIAIFTFANQRGCKWAQLRTFTRKEKRIA